MSANERVTSKSRPAVLPSSTRPNLVALTADIDGAVRAHTTDTKTEGVSTEDLSEGSSESAELAMNFAEISRELWLAPTVLDTLQRTVDFTVRTLEGCDGAGISFINDDAIVTPVWTEPTVVEIDNMQYRTGEGPCLDAIAQEATFYAEDLLRDPRWPSFGPQAAALGMRSLLSFRLAGKRSLGALNLYARHPRAFGVADRIKGLIFTIHAGVALAAAQELERATRALALETRRLAHVTQALASRDIISQAEGILMQRERITADQAFTLLRRASQHLNIRMRQVAQDVADTGALPSRSADEH